MRASYYQYSQHNQAQETLPVDQALYRDSNHVERFFNKLKQFHPVANPL